ncbi:MAG: hypothetical protein EB084_04420 [Proteobacteria bacterium]|nr:hypothetical protein [Pseudomonadota bacterium]
METTNSMFSRGYALRERLPLKAGLRSDLATAGRYRIEVDGRANDVDLLMHDGFVDPITAADTFSFSHIRPESLRALRKEPASLLTQDDYAVPISLRRQVPGEETGADARGNGARAETRTLP